MNAMTSVSDRSAAIAIRRSRLIPYKITVKKSLLRRFRHFIESTDWEDRYLCNSRIDGICLTVIIVSMLYFLPILITIILK